jgi:hypothetical protein
MVVPSIVLGVTKPIGELSTEPPSMAWSLYATPIAFELGIIFSY